MDNDFEKRLEELIHLELRKLSDLPAPDTLIPRVRSAIAAQARQPWCQRPMLTWPLAMRAAFIALLLCVLTWAGFYGGEITHGISVAFQRFAQLFAPLAPTWERVSVLANAVLILGRALSGHFLIFAALLLGVMYLTCVGIGTLCFRVSFVKR